MFDSMIQDLLSRHDPRQTNLPIKLADYESWQKLYTFDDNKNYNRSVPSDDKHTVYFGYYQSEQYFDEYSENIKSLFGALSYQRVGK